MDSVLDLGFELLDPTIRPHTTFDWEEISFRVLIVDLDEAFLHGALELVGNLSVSVTMEDTPSLESWLSQHLGLDLSIDFSGVLLDIESVWSSTG